MKLKPLTTVGMNILLFLVIPIALASSLWFGFKKDGERTRILKTINRNQIQLYQMQHKILSAVTNEHPHFHTQYPELIK